MTTRNRDKSIEAVLTSAGFTVTKKTNIDTWSRIFTTTDSNGKTKTFFVKGLSEPIYWNAGVHFSTNNDTMMDGWVQGIDLPVWKHIENVNVDYLIIPNYGKDRFKPKKTMIESLKHFSSNPHKVTTTKYGDKVMYFKIDNLKELTNSNMKELSNVITQTVPVTKPTPTVEPTLTVKPTPTKTIVTDNRTTFPKTETLEKFYTVQQSAELLSIKDSTLKARIKDGTLRVRRFGAKVIRIGEGDLLDFINRS